MSWINKLTGAKPRNRVFDAPLRPEHKMAIVGDIHGRDDLLSALLDQLGSEGLQRLVFVGDYVDRGPAAASVLERLQGLDDRFGDVTFLMGNHERMMLEFLDDPVGQGARWLRFRPGGLHTLQSFGVTGLTEDARYEERIAARDALRFALGDGEEWLRKLAFSTQSGNLWVVHGAADPDVAMDAQTEKALLWGHPDFFQTVRPDGQWVAHGHTIVDEAAATDGRIAVDTGAYQTGVLSAAIVGPDTPLRFVTAQLV